MAVKIIHKINFIVVLTVILLMIQNISYGESAHVLKIYYKLTPEEQHNTLNRDFAYINTSSYSSIIGTFGSIPSAILDDGRYVVLFIDVLASDAFISITKNIDEDIIKERILDYFLNTQETCYLALVESLAQQCNIKLAYPFNYAIVANFKYIFPGNYLFKIIKTFENKIRIEKR